MKKKMQKLIIQCSSGFVLLLFLSFSARAQVFVNLNSTGSNDGSAWVDAFTGLQEALAAAEPGDELWVAAGIYYPTAVADPDNISTGERGATFQLMNGVSVYGGFSGNETDLSHRDWESNVTILSGDINQSGTPEGNSFTVVNGSGTDSTAVLDGFTITGGNADHSTDSPISARRAGGGMFNQAGSPTLANLTISGNKAVNGGGIINLGGSSPTVTNIIFRENVAGINGGGVYNRQSSPVFQQVIFEDNEALWGGGVSNESGSHSYFHQATFTGNSANNGGGMYNDNSSPQLVEIDFTENSGSSGGGLYNLNSSPELYQVTFTENSSGSGGGMYNGGSSPRLTHVSFVGNRAPFMGNSGGGMQNVNSSPELNHVLFSGNVAHNGGGMRNTSGSPVLHDVTFTGNTAVQVGGGLDNLNNSSVVMVNVIFTGNSSQFNGGGMSNSGTAELYNVVVAGNTAINGAGILNNGSNASLTLFNISISGNTAEMNGGGLFNGSNGQSVFTNVIVWGNTAGSNGNELLIVENTSVVLNYSLYRNREGESDIIEAGEFTATNSLMTDPLFMDAGSGDLRLLAGSPAINAGDPETDLTFFPTGEENTPLDLDGNPRVTDGRIDIGAYEYGAAVSISYPTENGEPPADFTLEQNYPNPFNPQTVIPYSLNVATNVKIEVYDMLGRHVQTLVNSTMPAGRHQVSFDASRLSSGTYIYRFETTGYTETRKMTLLK